MRHRGNMTTQERAQRSQLAKIVHQEPFVQGSLVDSTFKCGKENCWCSKSVKGHPACYLSIRVGSKRKMVYVSKQKEKQMRKCVKNYQEIIKYMTAVSACCLERFKKE